MYLTNHRGHEVVATCPAAILANLCDRREQLSHWDHVNHWLFVKSFVADHDTGYGIVRENDPRQIKYIIWSSDEVLEVPASDALDLVEFFWKLIGDAACAKSSSESSSGSPKRRRRKTNSSATA